MHIAKITPVPKIKVPLIVDDFRPISVISVIARVFERAVVRGYLYPAFSGSEIKQVFDDQMGFRPSGFCEAAVIVMMNTVTIMPSKEDYVIGIYLDISKAFNRVAHDAISKKLAKFDMDDQIFNWIINFLSSRQHYTTLPHLMASATLLDKLTVM